ncbi:hypothetical protein ANN_04478 [Periplaneta americana]|uniref:PiggyBac transposable element-derived protein domain-containing protein n=1 Tax=Periplaneta americana TaxID=6978 RepID=A0ABQ8T8P6_PERAM|nr:hypothetical protein ANN_04478 [Periplaneta americana]
MDLESRQSRQIVGWLDEEDEQEIIQGESEDEDDHISESEHNTDTEQEQEAESSDDDCDNTPLSQFTTYKEGQYRQSNSPSDVVKRLITPISGTGRNVTFDNWFMSVPLAKELLSDHNLTCVGTVRLNKREIPPEFVQKRREQFSSIFGFQDRLTLTTYVPKPGKVVLVASTMHYDDELDPDTREEKIPEITFYSATKGGIDVVDELCGTYSVSRKSRRWPLTVFFGLLNITAINSLVIYKTNNATSQGPIIRRSFLKELALGLVKNHLAHRLTLKNLPLEIRSTIRRMNGVEELTQPTQKRMKMSSSRCEVCPRKKDRKTTTSCHRCNKMICKEHSVPFCEECADTGSGDSSINLICVPLGCLVSGAITQPLGRKKSMMLVNIPFIVAWIMFHYSSNVGMLYASLVLTGTGGGLLEAPTLRGSDTVTQIAGNKR